MPTSLTLAPAPSADAIRDSFMASLSGAQRAEAPYRHWLMTELFSADVVKALCDLPFPVPSLDGVSGARELHNNTRQYFDQDNIARHPVCAAVAEAFQHPRMVAAAIEATGCAIEGCSLRIEYAQDIDGFWLKPHTDLGVKKLTILVYLADAPDQQDLGTDIYRADQSWDKRYPFDSNTALVFVPSDITYHGFEPRPISGVRKSVIINYVTPEWRAREQLAFPDQPVSRGG